jgi:serine/threonine-protein kinase
MSSSRDHRKQLYERLVGQPVANGRFVITDLLGFGGMGAVYEALQKNMNRKVALKLIPTHDPTIVARFEREALTISKLQHPNTITVFDFGQSEDGFLYLSMELLAGRTLTEEIKEGPMPPKRAVHIASQMCRSLAEAHSAGIVHRDIKPDNIILIRVDDDPDVVKVLDFGIAKAVMGEDDVQLTGDGRIIGTPRYMSPEQILAEPLDHRSDIYSLGCILFEMLCGAPPFQQSSTTALMISHTQDPPPPFAQQLDTGLLSVLPGGLERVARRALAKQPDDRPKDCDQFREELEAAMAGGFSEQDSFETVGAIPTASGPLLGAPQTGAQPIPAPEAEKKGGGFLVGGILILVLVIGGLVGLQVMQGATPEEPAPAPVDPTTAVVEPTPIVEEVVVPPAPIVEGTPVATIKITTTPPGAKLYEEKSFLGKTPMSIPVEAVTSGLKKYTYRLVKDGHEELVVTIPVTPKDKDSEIEREFELTAVKRIRKPVSRPVTKKPKKDPKPAETTSPKVDLLNDGPTADVQRLK